MWSSIILYLLSPLLAYLTIVIIKELIPYTKHQIFYKSQKIKYKHIPILGWIGLYSGKKNQLESLKKIICEENSETPILAFNNFFGANLSFFLNSPDILKEFFIFFLKS